MEALILIPPQRKAPVTFNHFFACLTLGYVPHRITANSKFTHHNLAHNGLFLVRATFQKTSLSTCLAAALLHLRPKPSLNGHQWRHCHQHSNLSRHSPTPGRPTAAQGPPKELALCRKPQIRKTLLHYTQEITPSKPSA